MNRMNIQKDSENWKLDTRTNLDVEEKIKKLGSSYVPEWNFTTEDPDVGSVIAMLFAGQMSGNIERCNQVLEKYHTEFVNLLGISLLPPKPASATVLMEPVQDTIPGIQVPKGTKLLAEAEGGEEPLVFETTHNLYVTSSGLDYVFMTKADEGKMVPLKGTFGSGIDLISGTDAPKEIAENKTEEMLKRFRLFGSREKGIEKNALLFFHSVVLDVEEETIYLKFTGSGARQLLGGIREDKYGFWYYTEEGLLPVESIEIREEEDTILLQKKKINSKIEINGQQYSLLALIAKEPVEESIELESIAASSSGRMESLEHVSSGSTDFEVKDFSPFGDTLSLYQECFLGHNDYFSKSGSLIRMTFQLSYEEHRLLVSPSEDSELKIIKRKPRESWSAEFVDVYAEEISLEYYNGLGWKKLNCKEEYRSLFAEGKTGRVELSFHCPEDWQETGVGGYQGRCIRMQLLKSDNCYMRPGIHFCPRIRDMEVSFSYEDRYREPECLLALAGTENRDLTRQLKEGKSFSAFLSGIYSQDALYLGFSKKLEYGPISLLFRMEEGIRFEGVGCRFAYSTAKGFKQMKVLDYTFDMSRSGTVMFMPPADMQPQVLEGHKAYWICISPVRDRVGREDEMLPLVTDICVNAVQVTNIETREEEDFYLEEISPNMNVPLGVDHILDVELWVNEKNRLSRGQMFHMLEREPEGVRAEYDIYGEITSFYVRWDETQQLDDPPHRRCYVLDRMNNAILFGDGVRTEIPRVLDDVAFRVRIRCCNGSKGNLAAGKIIGVMGNLPFIDRIYNPVKAYGGADMEDLASALKRGSSVLRSRKRLVSTDDYLREIRSFSDSIDKVKCVTGRTIGGESNENAVSFVILLKDYAAGSYSFQSVAGKLKNHLHENCELTIARDEMHIVEPVFVKISVDVWAQVLHMDDSFEIQNLLQEVLEKYLDPVSNENGTGWEIGAIPKRPQLLMKLNVLKSKAVIQKMVVTARYTDYTGEHEVDLEDLKENPFYVCTSGTHRVNILITEGAGQC